MTKYIHFCLFLYGISLISEGYICVHADSGWVCVRQKIARDMYYWASTFWSQACLTLFMNLPPYWPSQIHRRPHHSGWSTCTRLHIQSYVGCPQSIAGWVDRGEPTRFLGFSRQSQLEGWTWHWLVSCWAQPYSDGPCCGLYIDYIWLSGMGLIMGMARLRAEVAPVFDCA
jgi:hypothetical protein